MRLSSVVSPSAWRRLLVAYGRRWYPRLAVPLFDARFVGEGIITKHFVSGPSYRQSLVEATAAHCMRSANGMFLSIGVARGDAALGVMRNVAPPNDYWLVDAWDGRRTATDANIKGGYTADFDTVKAAFAQWPNVNLLRGLVPSVLSQLPHGSIAWAHFNLADQESEIPALAMIGSRLHPRGIILVDAWGRPSCTDDQRRRYNETAAKLGLSVIPHATGHAQLMRRD